MKIGDKVRVKQDIYEYPDGDSPGGYCAEEGDIVIIREIKTDTNFVWNHSVSHEDRIDGHTFAVGENEIEAINEK